MGNGKVNKQLNSGNTQLKNILFESPDMPDVNFFVRINSRNESSIFSLTLSVVGQGDRNQ